MVAQPRSGKYGRTLDQPYSPIHHFLEWLKLYFHGTSSLDKCEEVRRRCLLFLDRVSSSLLQQTPPFSFFLLQQVQDASDIEIVLRAATYSFYHRLRPCKGNVTHANAQKHSQLLVDGWGARRDQDPTTCILSQAFPELSPAAACLWGSPSGRP